MAWVSFMRSPEARLLLSRSLPARSIKLSTPTPHMAGSYKEHALRCCHATSNNMIGSPQHVLTLTVSASLQLGSQLAGTVQLCQCMAAKLSTPLRLVTGGLVSFAPDGQKYDTATPVKHGLSNGSLFIYCSQTQPIGQPVALGKTWVVAYQ